MSQDKLYNKFKPNVFFQPDEYLNGWARKCGWKATLVYNSLWRHADENGRSFPSMQLMADEHGVSRKTIEKGLKTLVDFNLVKREQKKNTETGKFLYNTYSLTDKVDWKDPYPLAGSTVHRTPSQSITVPPGVPTKDTHNKDTHKRSSNTIVYKDISWLTSMSKDDIIDWMVRFPDLPENLIKKEANKAYLWLTENKNGESKNPKLFFHNWLDNVIKKYNGNYAQTEPTISFQE